MRVLVGEKAEISRFALNGGKDIIGTENINTDIPTNIVLGNLL